jgi:drug/metabolite transporter (DMT)-like permease
MHKNKFNEFDGIVIVVLSSICFAIVPNSAKIALDNGSSLMLLLFSRCLIGMLLLIPFIFFQKKTFFVSRSLIIPTVFTSLTSVILIAATYHAIEFLDVALVFMILYLFPVGIAMISHYRKEDYIQVKQWISILFIMLGIGFMVLDTSFTANIYGFAISIFGLFFMLIFIYSSGKLTNQIGSGTMNLHINFWSTFFLALIIISTDLTLELPTNQIGWVAIVCNGFFYVLSYVLFFEGSQKVGIIRTSVISSTEPLFVAIFALLFLNQSLTRYETLGFSIVLVSLYFFEKFKSVPKTT